MNKIRRTSVAKVVDILEEVYRVSQLENARFLINKEKDAAVKEIIRPWVYSWINRPVEQAMSILYEELERGR